MEKMNANNYVQIGTISHEVEENCFTTRKNGIAFSYIEVRESGDRP